ncbi:hypothetical protein N7504_012010 [Penicillium tannophilum]|nr:hypothetical protein N7504_012010 [Penicillium tannophilum]
MASSQSSSASIAARGPGSVEPKAMPQLDTLISHLLAAKRSLSSISHVWRANEIVTAARSALEGSVVVSSRTGFLRRGLDNQLRLLFNVRSEIEEISYRGREEFSEALTSLDAADARLRSTLDLLRETIVHASFRPTEEQTKSLHDFVDERGVEELHAALKSSIDRTNTARADLDTSNREFDDELHAIRKALRHYRSTTKMASSRASASSSSSCASEPDLQALSTMPSMLRSLEMQAQEMAVLLSSLVRHFDLCVTAVKQTEGGGAAAHSITGDMPAEVGATSSEGLSNIGEEINANLNAPLDPMTDQEYEEMVQVLLNDAPEAEDVVIEIHDRINEMETIFEQMGVQRDSLLSISDATLQIHRHLSTLASTRLPQYISQAHNFIQVWSEENDRFNSGLTELSDLHSLYDGFLNAYDNLILEVARRNHVRHRVEKVLRDTRNKLNHLYEEDVAARQIFRVEQGDFLPSDIWPGVGQAPMHVEFLRLPGGNLEGALPEAQGQVPAEAATGPEAQIAHAGSEEEEIVPDLPKEVVEHAYARLKARTREFV